MAKCLLIDYDYAITVGPGRMQQASHGSRTVRFVFISCSQDLKFMHIHNFTGNPTIHGSRNYAPVWEDFKPFVRNLLVKFFPSSPAHPNKITPEDMLAILNEARSVVKEPHAPRDSILSDHPSESVTRRYATLVGTKQDRLGQDSVSIPKQLEQDISKQLKQDNAPRFVSTLSQLESLGPPSL
jgi:hypothetical protein